MSHPIKPLPQHESSSGGVGTGRIVLWFLLISVAVVSRVWILGFWIFGGQLGNAFGSWIVPTLGFFILPWTTLLYAWMWAVSSDGVSGLEWTLVAAGFVIDVVFWVVGRRSLR